MPRRKGLPKNRKAVALRHRQAKPVGQRFERGASIVPRQRRLELARQYRAQFDQDLSADDDFMLKHLFTPSV